MAARATEFLKCYVKNEDIGYRVGRIRNVEAAEYTEPFAPSTDI